MEKWKKITKNLLLCFVLISIGYSLGRNFSQSSPGSVIEPHYKDVGDKSVYVYYFHSAFRCASCNSIEEKTKAVLDSDYKKNLEDGSIKWSSEDFQKNEALARDFNVYGSGVVIALLDGRKIVESRQLDEVWTLLDKPADFNTYLKSNINEFLKLREETI